MPLILGAQSATAVAQDNSCRFNQGDSPKLSRTPGSNGSATIGTFSAWIKRGTTGADTGIFSSYISSTDFLRIQFDGNDILMLGAYVSSSWILSYKTTRVFTDSAAWYHIVCSVDSTDGVAADRQKIYVNGVRETLFSTSTDLGSSDAMPINQTTNDMRVGLDNAAYCSGYMAEVCWIDGTAYAASDFGEFDSDSPTIWKPKDVSGLTFGTNGFYLDFEDSDNLGDDESGNANDLAETNLVAADQATDTPVNNFATLNPLLQSLTNPTVLSEGNCKSVLVGSADADWGGASTIGLSAGKWYWEIKPSTLGSSIIGITDDPAEVVRDSQQELTLNVPISYGYKGSDGNKKVNVSGSEVSSSYGDSYTTTNIIGVTLNMDDLELKFYKDNTVQDSGTAISILASTHSGFYFPATSKTGTATTTFEWNFGGCSSFAITSEENDENGYGNFEYAPPSGFLAICTKNLGSDGG